MLGFKLVSVYTIAARGRRFFRSFRGPALRAALPACPTRIWEAALAEASLKARRAPSQVLSAATVVTESLGTMAHITFVPGRMFLHIHGLVRWLCS